MNRGLFSRIVLIGIVVAAALLVAAVLYGYQSRTIPVARVDLPGGTLVNETMFEQVSIADTSVIRGYTVTSLDELKDKRTAVLIRAGLPMTTTMFADGTVVDPQFPSLPASEADLFKLFIPSDLARSTGGTVKPGGLVNLLLVDPNSETVKWVLQRVRVVAAQSDTGSSVTPGGKTPVAGFLLALTPSELTLVASYKTDLITLVPIRDETPSIPRIPCSRPSTTLDDPCYSQDAAVAASPTPELSPTPAPSVEPGASTPPPASPAASDPTASMSPSPIPLPTK